MSILVKAMSVTLLGACIGFTPLAGVAQQDHSGHGSQGQGGQMQHDGDGGADGQRGGMMNRGDGDGDDSMMRRGMRRMQNMMNAGDGPATVGQSAFAVIRDVVNTLQADPDTDWSQINIEALRRHLVDMDRVTLYAEAAVTEIEGGARYAISGEDERTVAAIQRMVPTHALQIERELDWDTSTTLLPDGVELTVVSDDPDQAIMIRGLGFIGFMVQGEHHADHHLMMAGGSPEGASSGRGGGMNRSDGDHSGGHH